MEVFDVVEVIEVRGIVSSIVEFVRFKCFDLCIVDVIVVEDIGKFLDNNIVEVL